MFRLLIILICATWVVGEELYPDWRCHKDYDNSTDQDWRGTGRILKVMKLCKPQKPDCYKICILQWHHILGGNEDNEIWLRGITETVDHTYTFFFNSNANVTNVIIENIHSKCTSALEKVRKATCAERKDFISCMEKAWACQTK